MLRLHVDELFSMRAVCRELTTLTGLPAMNIKRVVLFLATNLAVMLVLSLVASPSKEPRPPWRPKPSRLAMVMGFGGAFISLFMSKMMAKWSTGAEIIDQPRNQTEAWLVDTVARHAQRAGIAMPEVAIYEGEPNAFATGPSRNNSLVAVSTGLLHSMNQEEVEAVIAHEVAHVANGDMVTLTLIQGVVNTFVFFLARVVGSVVDSALRRDNESSGHGIGYMVTVFVCEIAFGILASMIVAYFSRQREYAADAGAAQLMGNARPMINALRRLGGVDANDLPKDMQAMGIAGGAASLFASHPSLEERIAALQQQ